MATVTTTTPTNDSFIFNINNNYYWFAAILVNLSSRAHKIRPSGIKELVLEDNFQNFYHSGYIVIDNRMDALEQNFTSTDAAFSNTPFTLNPESNPSPANPLEGFILQGDGRDILVLNIMPCLNESDPNDFGNEDQQKLFRISLELAIYHSEDIEGENGEKYKKLYFWDIYYQLMREKNSYFSTAYYLNGGLNQNNPDDTSLFNKTNEERGIPTGLALKALLQESFNNDDELSKYPVNFELESPNAGTNPSWDEGATSMFFSAPAQFKVIDSLNYILSRHVSTVDNNYDQCFLHLERYPRVFTFKSLKKFFDKAYESNEKGGEYYLETFKIAGYTQATGYQSILEPVFELDLVPNRGLYLNQFAAPINFNYSDISGIYSQRELVSRIVHSYNNNDKMFQVDCYENNINEIYSLYQSNYVNEMKGGSNVPNFKPGALRTENYNTHTTFTTMGSDPIQRFSAGRNKALYTSVFAGGMITFRVPGSTHRQAGRFIGIDRDNASENNIYDNKILGIYFIVEVRHIFRDSEYINELKCVKTYYGTELNAPSL